MSPWHFVSEFAACDSKIRKVPVLTRSRIDTMPWYLKGLEKVSLPIIYENIAINISS